MRNRAFWVLVMAMAFASNAVATVESASVREWNFRVLLNDDEIGYHRYRLEADGERRRVESEASFDVRFLFFTAYRYRHSLSEEWNGACLESIETDTDANGKDVSVTGRKSDSAFIVDTGANVAELPPCIRTFAYWDANILEADRLLNPQTGEYVDVTIEPLAEEVLNVRGEPMPARSYRITADGLRIDVWYSADYEWLALESPAKGGRTLRYELT